MSNFFEVAKTVMISCITGWVGNQLVSTSQVEEVLLSKVRNTLPAGQWSFTRIGLLAILIELLGRQIPSFHLFLELLRLLGTYVYLPKTLLKMNFLFQRWDMRSCFGGYLIITFFSTNLQ